MSNESYKLQEQKELEQQRINHVHDLTEHMVGKCYRYEEEVHTIKSVHADGVDAVVETDKHVFKFRIEDLREELREFEAVSKEAIEAEKRDDNMLSDIAVALSEIVKLAHSNETDRGKAKDILSVSEPACKCIIDIYKARTMRQAVRIKIK